MQVSTILMTAVCDLVYQSETWAHADFYFSKNARDQEAFGEPGGRPWRGIMSPPHRRVIQLLEEEAGYKAPELPLGPKGPGA